MIHLFTSFRCLVPPQFDRFHGEKLQPKNTFQPLLDFSEATLEIFVAS